MTCYKIIEILFDSGNFTLIQKLFMVFYYWILGQLTNDEATSLFQKCGFTFTIPSASNSIDVNILSDSSSNTYTVVSLINEYNAKYYQSSDIMSVIIKFMIDNIYTAGYITSDEKNTLKALTW